jgi:putative tricarboxylic transport membrane protein
MVGAVRIPRMNRRVPPRGRHEKKRRALLLSRGDPSIFIYRPISAGLLALTALMLAWALWGTVRKGIGGRPEAEAPEGPAS